ncbi:hypothetical protein AVEN_28073-1, partial [Araneus ventricosus]
MLRVDQVYAEKSFLHRKTLSQTQNTTARGIVVAVKQQAYIFKRRDGVSSENPRTTRQYGEHEDFSCEIVFAGLIPAAITTQLEKYQ